MQQMKITKSELEEIIKEEIKETLMEIQLAPAMYKALQDKGQLPP